MPGSGSKGHVTSHVKHVKTFFPVREEKPRKKTACCPKMTQMRLSQGCGWDYGKRKLSVRNEDFNVIVTCLFIYRTVYLIIN